MALAGLDTRVPLATWLDAVYAIVVDAPAEKLEGLHKAIVLAGGRARPDRDTWGTTPEQQALAIKPRQIERG